MRRGAAFQFRSAALSSNPVPEFVMLEMYLYYQLARHPLQALTKRLVCQGLAIATAGKHRCRGDSSVTPGAD
jgi:hypothetical protein